MPQPSQTHSDIATATADEGYAQETATKQLPNYVMLRFLNMQLENAITASTPPPTGLKFQKKFPDENILKSQVLAELKRLKKIMMIPDPLDSKKTAATVPTAHPIDEPTEVPQLIKYGKLSELKAASNALTTLVEPPRKAMPYEQLKAYDSGLGTPDTSPESSPATPRRNPNTMAQQAPPLPIRDTDFAHQEYLTLIIQFQENFQDLVLQATEHYIGKYKTALISLITDYQKELSGKMVNETKAGVNQTHKKVNFQLSELKKQVMNASQFISTESTFDLTALQTLKELPANFMSRIDNLYEEQTNQRNALVNDITALKEQAEQEAVQQASTANTSASPSYVNVQREPEAPFSDDTYAVVAEVLAQPGSSANNGAYQNTSTIKITEKQQAQTSLENGMEALMTHKETLIANFRTVKKQTDQAMMTLYDPETPAVNASAVDTPGSRSRMETMSVKHPTHLQRKTPRSPGSIVTTIDSSTMSANKNKNAKLTKLRARAKTAAGRDAIKNADQSLTQAAQTGPPTGMKK